MMHRKISLKKVDFFTHNYLNALLNLKLFKPFNQLM